MKPSRVTSAGHGRAVSKTIDKGPRDQINGQYVRSIKATRVEERSKMTVSVNLENIHMHVLLPCIEAAQEILRARFKKDISLKEQATGWKTSHS